MSITKTIGRGAALNTTMTIVGKVIVFVNVFMILRHLSVHDYGLSELVLSAVSTLGFFSLPGLSSAIIADLGVGRGRDDFASMKTLFLQFFWLTVILGIVAWALLFFASGFVAEFSGLASVGYYLGIISFLFLIGPLRSVAQMLATVELRFLDQSLYTVLEEIVKGLLLLILFFVFNFGLEGLLWSVVLSQFVVLILYIPRTISAYAVFGHARAQGWYKFWTLFGAHRKWSIGSSYIGTLGSNLQIWIVRLLLGTEAVGLYAFADGVYSHLGSLLPLGGVLTPIMPRYIDKLNELIRIIKTSLKIQVWLCTALIVGALLFSPVLIIIFPNYQGGLALLCILTLSIIASGISMIINPIFYALKKQSSLFQSLILKIFFAILFIPISIELFGIPGIGIGCLLTQTATIVERYIKVEKFLPGLYLSFQELFILSPEERVIGRELWKDGLRNKLIPAPVRRMLVKIYS